MRKNSGSAVRAIQVTLPVFFLMCAAVALVYVFPGIVTWLPQQMSS